MYRYTKINYVWNNHVLLKPPIVWKVCLFHHQWKLAKRKKNTSRRSSIVISNGVPKPGGFLAATCDLVWSFAKLHGGSNGTGSWIIKGLELKIKCFLGTAGSNVYYNIFDHLCHCGLQSPVWMVDSGLWKFPPKNRDENYAAPSVRPNVLCIPYCY